MDILRLVGALLFMIALIILSLKLAGPKLNTINRGRYVNILERTQLSKNASIIVARIGDEGYVISVSEHSSEVILKLSKEELTKMETNKQEQTLKYPENFKEFYGIIKKNIKDIKKNRK